jgi:hypothetical protein
MGGSLRYIGKLGYGHGSRATGPQIPETPASFGWKGRFFRRNCPGTTSGANALIRGERCPMARKTTRKPDALGN